MVQPTCLGSRRSGTTRSEAGIHLPAERNAGVPQSNRSRRRDTGAARPRQDPQRLNIADGDVTRITLQRGEAALYASAMEPTAACWPQLEEADYPSCRAFADASRCGAHSPLAHAPKTMSRPPPVVASTKLHGLTQGSLPHDRAACATQATDVITAIVAGGVTRRRVHVDQLFRRGVDGHLVVCVSTYAEWFSPREKHR